MIRHFIQDCCKTIEMAFFSVLKRLGSTLNTRKSGDFLPGNGGMRLKNGRLIKPRVRTTEVKV